MGRRFEPVWAHLFLKYTTQIRPKRAQNLDLQLTFNVMGRCDEIESRGIYDYQSQK